MSPFALALRGLLRQPARAALGIIGVAVVGALLFDMLLLSRGLVLSFESLLDEMGFDIRVTATEAMPGMGPSIPDASTAWAELTSLSEIEQVVPVRYGEAEIDDGGQWNQVVTLMGSGGRQRGVWTVLEGRDLYAEETSDSSDALPPLLIDGKIREALDAHPGDTLRLRGRCQAGDGGLPPVDFRIVGVVGFQFGSPGHPVAATTLDAFARTCATADPDEIDFFLVASRLEAGTATALAAIQRSLPDLHAFSNAQLVSRVEATDFSYFRQISFALTVVTLFFAFLLIAALLTVSVNQRFGEIAALRAIGFTRSRVVADLLWESALFVGTGGLLAIPLGLLLAQWLDGILRSMPGFPEKLRFFVFAPGSALVYVALLLVTGVLAAAYPVVLAARLPIAATLRKETVG